MNRQKTQFHEPSRQGTGWKQKQNLIKSGILKIYSVFFDKRCLSCGEIVSAEEVASFGHALCPACRDALFPNPVNPASSRSHYAPLQNQSQAWAGFVSLGPYDGLLRQLILDLKFRSALHVADLLGSLLAAHLQHENLGSFDLIVPVPLHLIRLQERGYNQSLEIGKRISRSLDVPIHTDRLLKIRHSPPQETLNLGERKNAVKGVFTVTASFAGTRVLLVDDVITTGSTLKECAQLLLQAGASRVTVAVAAQAGPHQAVY